MIERARKVRVAIFPDLPTPYKTGYIKTKKAIRMITGISPILIDTGYFSVEQEKALPHVQDLQIQRKLDL